ncbi:MULTISPECIES: M48 family metalloprotease [Bacillus]|uniref:M48 family metalloprotease n=1 Tax=Bacillus TaxID=1386 RepID=UPI00084B60B9|nr:MULTISPECIES: M48 family metalloprotease [Bacillus]MBL4963215.1 M48 family metalloprotease [Bacillus halotolerans]OEC78717.1 peptidase M48 [Bacillus halotolerans]PHI45519.1 peptidase M48 [Bacillus halotolerans]PSA98014.1 peptidase M48 [Bacillus halotolerans]UZD51465.1 M48 family metalloprotease [Bacillus halotolerans]
MEVRKCKYNYTYIGWSCLTVFISIFLFKTVFPVKTFQATCFILLVYGIFFILNYGFFGDWKNRIRMGLRRPATLYEKQYLSNINDEVYRNVQRQYPTLKKADVFVINHADTNAVALGFKTIGITSAAMNQLTEGQLKAVVAHEYGHLANKDTLHFTLFNAGFAALTAALLPLYIIGFFLSLIFAFFEGFLGGSNATVTTGLFKLFFKMVNLAQVQYFRMGFYFVNFGSRDFEYRADEVAAKAGYGQELLSFFYDLERENIESRKGFLALLASTHPYTAYRIENIESFISREPAQSDI